MERHQCILLVIHFLIFSGNSFANFGASAEWRPRTTTEPVIVYLEAVRYNASFPTGTQTYSRNAPHYIFPVPGKPGTFHIYGQRDPVTGGPPEFSLAPIEVVLTRAEWDYIEKAQPKRGTLKSVLMGPALKVSMAPTRHWESNKVPPMGPALVSNVGSMKEGPPLEGFTSPQRKITYFAPGKLEGLPLEQPTRERSAPPSSPAPNEEALALDSGPPNCTVSLARLKR